MISFDLNFYDQNINAQAHKTVFTYLFDPKNVNKLLNYLYAIRCIQCAQFWMAGIGLHSLYRIQSLAHRTKRKKEKTNEKRRVQSAYHTYVRRFKSFAWGVEIYVGCSFLFEFFVVFFASYFSTRLSIAHATQIISWMGT